MQRNKPIIWLTRGLGVIDDNVPDMSHNPELIMIVAQGDREFCDEVISLWMAGQAVTKPRRPPEGS